MNDKPIYLSKRFVSALAGVILMLVVALVPALAAYEAVLVEAITQVILALIAGYSLTDVARTYLTK
jgi:hypothetical protein